MRLNFAPRFAQQRSKSIQYIRSILLTGLASVALTQVHATTTLAQPSTCKWQADATVVQAKPKIALVLGSGGARGYAHIGVIDVLEQNGIRPDMIVGTSAGSIVGAIYASGKTPEQMKNIAMDLKSDDVRDFTLSKQGFFDGKKIADYVNAQVDNTLLENMKIPFYVVATELKSGQDVIFRQGDTGKAVMASTSIPSMFVPTKIGEQQYVDGGLVHPVPVTIAKQLGADLIIAVDILARPEYTETSNVWGLFNQNINIMQNRLADYEVKQADIVIRPDIREKAHVFSVGSRMQTIQAGEVAAQNQIDQLQKVLSAKTYQLQAEHDDLQICQH
ncbi:NTE family protein [Acinetobacter marinus]|uniref:NTE family protein n=1 Tax=Acinetobacter marinus TaxID=281375 RepID=A0A1G6J2Q8_9GAMM|nr:NTE family protein [Acinetobacter marinus]